MHRNLFTVFLVLITTEDAFLQSTICGIFDTIDVLEQSFPKYTFGNRCIKQGDDVTSWLLCKIWACSPKKKSCNTVIGIDGCEICDDTCSDGGKVHDKGESWTCSDGTNTCRCFPNGLLTSSRVAPSGDSMCKTKFPGHIFRSRLFLLSLKRRLFRSAFSENIPIPVV